MGLERFPQLPSDREDGVQRRSGILGYERHPAAPDPADLLLLQLEKLSLFERDAPADDPAGSRQKPQERHDRGRLAGSRLSDDTQGLARSQIEGDLLDGVNDSGRQEEAACEVLDGEEQWVFDAAASAGRSPRTSDTVTGPLSGTCIAQCLITLVKKSQLILKSSLTLVTFLR